MKVLLIINPVAGRTNARTIEKAQAYLDSCSIDYTPVFTEKDKDAEWQTREHFGDEYTHLLVMGGDGSLNQAVNGLPDFSKPIGILPFGSGNDYIKNFSGFDSNRMHAIDALVEGMESQVSIGLCNNRRFINSMGLGFDGQIAFNMERSKTWFKGHAAYYYHVIKILGFYREQNVTLLLDGETLEVPLLLMVAGMGHTFGGGFKILPNADPSSSQLHVTIIERLGALWRFAWLGKLKSGNHDSIKQVRHYRASKIRVEPVHVHSQIDGELMGTPPFDISVLPEKVRFLAG